MTPDVTNRIVMLTHIQNYILRPYMALVVARPYKFIQTFSLAYRQAKLEGGAHSHVVTSYTSLKAFSIIYPLTFHICFFSCPVSVTRMKIAYLLNNFKINVMVNKQIFYLKPFFNTVVLTVYFLN